MTSSAAAPDDPAPLAFSCARSVAPMLWAMVALASLELFVVHLLVALLWSPKVALFLSLATLASIVWLVLLIRSFPQRPVLVDSQIVVMGVGSLWRIELPRRDIQACRMGLSGADLSPRGVLNLALLAFPNVLVEMSEPASLGRGRRPITAVAHRLDDPTGFCAALAAPSPE